jgi:hypothetical protein
MGDNLDEQRPVVVEYSTPPKPKRGNHLAIIAFVFSMISVAALLLGEKSLLPERVMVVIVIGGAAGAAGAGVIGLRHARGSEGSGRGLAWAALIVGGMIILLIAGIVLFALTFTGNLSGDGRVPN